MKKGLVSRHTINWLISATLLCLLISTGHAATTEVTGTYRYVTENDFRYFRKQPLVDGNAYLSDFALGIGATFRGAKDGDKWEFEIIRPESTTTSRIWTVKFRASYDGKSNCFIDFGMFTYTRSSCNSSGTSTYTAAREIECLALGDWTLQVRYTPGDGGTEQVFTGETIPAISTGADVKLGLSTATINPEVIIVSPTGVTARGMTPFEPGTTDVTATVTDSGCPAYPIVDQLVTINSTTVAGSGGHTHLEEQQGTGYFNGVPNAKSISLITDDTGRVFTTYTAGVVGVEEKIKAVTVTDDLLTNEAIRDLSIHLKAAGVYLTPLPDPTISQSPDYEIYQTPSGTLKHADSGITYGTAKLIHVITELARDVKEHRQVMTGQETVRLMSVNDISLPNGGVFDQCKNLTDCRDIGGHVSHEEGIDFDLNNTGGYTEGQFDIHKDLVWLVERAKYINPSCWKQHNIHIRCNNALF